MSFFQTLKTGAPQEWQAYTEHPFTNAMADGSLPEAAFRYYLVQDYLFLIEFARAYALAAYKAPSLADLRKAAAGVSAIIDVEMDLHVTLCQGWGLSADDLEQAPAAAETLAYTRYVLDAGMRGDLLALKTALSPCVIGYAEIASRLATRPGALSDDNPYAVWIAEYSGAGYREVAAQAEAHLDDLAGRYLTEARQGELLTVFREATRLEADFWDMGLRAAKCGA
ncbi:MAG: thiaminase II [Pseudomonadota bacterium]